MAIKFDLNINGSDAFDLNSDEFVIKEQISFTSEYLNLSSSSESVGSDSDKVDINLTKSMEKVWSEE
jgi:hypothetical protein